MASIPYFWLFGILSLHWVADFYLQTDEMAINKSKSNSWLAKHVLIYTVTLYFGMMAWWLFLLNLAAFTFLQLTLWVIINGILHFLQDYLSSRVTAELWQKGDRHNFFVVIGLDQFVHYVCLFGTFYWILQ